MAEKTLEQKMNDDYQKGRAIVDIARIHNVEVEDVLRATGNEDLMTVYFVGDQIDAKEAGPNSAPISHGTTSNVRYTKN